MFTLAHELGHVLAGDGSEIKIDEGLRGNNDEERLANAFAAPLAGLLDVETEELVEKLRKAWETADAITEDYSTPKDSPEVVERAYDADPIAA